MLKFLKPFVYASVLAGTAFPVQAEKYGLGRVALPEEIAAWDWDVSPDGTGLPIGSGDAIDGEELFADKCASCHGDFAEGMGGGLSWQAVWILWRMKIRSRPLGLTGLT